MKTETKKRGRRKKEGGQLVHVGCRVDRVIADALNSVSIEKGTSISDLLREVLLCWFHKK